MQGGSGNIWKGWQGDVYYMPVPGQLVWCARYSEDIEADLARGFSYASWIIKPAATEAEAIRDTAEAFGVWDWHEDDEEVALEKARERLEELGYFIAELDGRFLVAREGLCAFIAPSPEEAIETAKADSRFGDTPLWVFLARYLGPDDDNEFFAGFAARVEVVAETRATLRRV